MSGLRKEDVEQIDMGVWTGSFEHKPLVQKAQALGGMCTKRFNQGMAGNAFGLKDVLDGIRERDSETWGGACWGLALIWTANHANDTDFWGKLYGDRSKTMPAPAQKGVRPLYGDMDMPTLMRIVGLHGVLTGRNFTGGLPARGPGVSGDDYQDSVLVRAGMVRDSNGDAKKRGVGGGANNLLGYVLAGKRDRYKIVNFWPQGRKSGHACAIWIGEDVTWFDANIGEFWLPNHNAFRTWFNDYWVRMYTNAYETFECRAYGRGLSGRP